jgi:RNA recognition motif-containing protein
VSISDKEKRKKKNKNKSALGAVSAPLAALPQDMTDLKLNNLPHGVADSSIRIIFEGFTVSKVIVKQGYAFVGIATSEVDRAIEELSGKMVGGRKMSVKVSQRKKQ